MRVPPELTRPPFPEPHGLCGASEAGVGRPRSAGSVRGAISRAFAKFLVKPETFFFRTPRAVVSDGAQ